MHSNMPWVRRRRSHALLCLCGAALLLAASANPFGRREGLSTLLHDNAEHDAEQAPVPGSGWRSSPSYCSRPDGSTYPCSAAGISEHDAEHDAVRATAAPATAAPATTTANAARSAALLLAGDAECGGRGFAVHFDGRARCECHHGFRGADSACATDRGGPATAPIKAAMVIMAHGRVGTHVAEVAAALTTELRLQNIATNIIPMLDEQAASVAMDVVIAYGDRELFAAGGGPHRELHALAAKYDGREGRRRVRLVRCVFAYPPHSNWTHAFEAEAPDATCSVHGQADQIDYRHMGHWRGYQFLRLPIFAEYDYWWQFDDQMQLKQPLPCDPFRAMARSGAVLGVFKLHSDSESCSGDTVGVAERFMRAHRIERAASPELLDRARPGLYFGGGSLIFKASFWSSPAALAYSRAWSDSAIAYLHRSDEQKLVQKLVAVLAPPAAVHVFSPRVWGGVLEHERSPFSQPCGGKWRLVEGHDYLVGKWKRDELCSRRPDPWCVSKPGSD